jgi:hypothetical protein
MAASMASRTRNGPSTVARTTLRLPQLLDRNLEAYSLRENRQKTEVLIEALREYLTRKRVNPDKPPTISW